MKQPNDDLPLDFVGSKSCAFCNAKIDHGYPIMTSTSGGNEALFCGVLCTTCFTLLTSS